MEKSLKDLLARLPIPGLKESAERHEIARLLSDELGIPVAPGKIVFKDGIITVSVPPVMKSALQMRSAQLLEKLRAQGIKATSFR